MRRWRPHLVSALWIARSAAMGGAAQQPVARFPITGASVAEALRSGGIAVDPAQVQLPAGLSSSTSTPVLKLSGAEMLQDGRMRVRLLCGTGRECIPFLATVRLREDDKALFAAFSRIATAQAKSPLPTASGPALKVGQRALLLIEDGLMHITLPVVSIDSGSVGAEVRVSSLDRKETFRGVVIGAGAVRGRLP